MRPVLVSLLAALCLWLIADAVVHPGPSFVLLPLSTRSGPATDRIAVAFRNDDLSVFSDPMREDSVISVFRRHGVSQTYAFIPDPAGYLGDGGGAPPTSRTILDSLRAWQRQGLIEFALHGATHVRSPRAGGEFDGVPADVQVTRIRNAKRMADSLLESNIRIFAPPWNQADCATLRACDVAGLAIFSGFLGACPHEKVIPVNTAAELFPDSSGLPSFEAALSSAREGRGQRILVGFYHSRVDFNRAGRYEYLDKLLKDLRSDPRVELTTIDELARKLPDLLSAQNMAGVTMLQADRAASIAGPYAGALQPVLGAFGLASPRDPDGSVALRAFWRGEYDHAGDLAQERIRHAALTTRAARGVAGVLTVALMLALTWSMRRWSFRLRLAIPGALGVLLPALLVGAMIFFPSFSDERISDLGGLMSMVIGATVLVLLVHGVGSGNPRREGRSFRAASDNKPSPHDEAPGRRG